jgi:hypothetical protein
VKNQGSKIEIAAARRVVVMVSKIKNNGWPTAVHRVITDVGAIFLVPA